MNEYSHVKETIIDERKIRQQKCLFIAVIILAVTALLVATAALILVHDPSLKERYFPGPDEDETTEEETEETTSEYVETDVVDANTRLNNNREEILKSVVALFATNVERETLANDVSQSAIEAEVTESIGESTADSTYVTVITEDDDSSDEMETGIDTESYLDGIISLGEGNISSGVILNTDNNYIYVLCLYSTIKGNEHIYAILSNGYAYEAELYKKDTYTDVAIVTIDINDLSEEATFGISVATISKSAEVSSTDPILYVGNPFSDTVTYDSVGFVSGSYAYISTLDMVYRVVRTNIFISADNGFLFDSYGELVGIVNGSESIIEAIVANDLQLFVNKLIKDEDIVVFGVYGELVDDEMRTLSGLDLPSGLYVTAVLRNSPAYGAGIQPGDIIVKVGDNTITNMTTLKTCLQNVAAGDKLVITLKRQTGDGFNTYAVTVSTESRPD